MVWVYLINFLCGSGWVMAWRVFCLMAGVVLGILNVEWSNSLMV